MNLLNIKCQRTQSSSELRFFSRVVFKNSVIIKIISCVVLTCPWCSFQVSICYCDVTCSWAPPAAQQPNFNCNLKGELGILGTVSASVESRWKKKVLLRVSVVEPGDEIMFLWRGIICKKIRGLCGPVYLWTSCQVCFRLNHSPFLRIFALQLSLAQNLQYFYIKQTKKMARHTFCLKYEIWNREKNNTWKNSSHLLVVWLQHHHHTVEFNKLVKLA